MTTFIEDFIEFTKDYESPDSFWKWGAFTAVGAVLRDNIFTLQKTSKICANIYTLLLADSSFKRKGRPIHEVGNIVQKLEVTKVIRGRSSIQAIIEDLAMSETHKKTGNKIAGGSCLLCADELSSFFVIDEKALIPLLTDIYDWREEWTSSLKSTGKFKVENLCVSFFAATNEELLQKVYTSEAVRGGLLARTFLVKAEGLRKPNSWFGDIDLEATNREWHAMLKKLKDISAVKGVVRVDKDAQAEYDSWYFPLYEKYGSFTDKTGVMGRIHTGVLKLAMIMGANNNLEPVIKKREIQEAIFECSKLLGNYDVYAMSVGKSETNQASIVLLDMLWESPTHSISQRAVLQQYWSEFTHETLELGAATLEKGGLITIHIGKEVTYVMTEKCKEFYKK